MGVRKGLRRRANARSNEVIERGRVLNTRAAVLKIPQETEGLEHGGSTVRGSLAGGGVGTVSLDVALGSVRREQPGRDTATETVEAESVRAAIVGLLGVGLVVRADGKGRGNVIEESTSLIEGDEEKGLVPLRTGADGVVDLLDEHLTVGDVAGGVHGVGVQATAGGVDVGQLGEDAQVGVLVEVLEGNDVALGVLRGPVEEHGIGEEGTVGTVVVEPRDALLRGSLEDAAGLDGGDIEIIVVLSVAIGETGDRTETVRVGRLIDGQFDVCLMCTTEGTYTRDTRVPVVEGGELINHVNNGGDLALGVVSQDLVSSTLGRDLRVGEHVTLDKARQVGGQSTVGNGGIVRVVLAEELEVGTSERVIGIVDHRVVVLVLAGPLGAVGVADILQVVERTVVDNVGQTLLLDSTQNVVKSTVFEKDPDNVLNLVLHVGNGLLGARLVAEGGAGMLVHSGTKGGAGQADQGNESGGLHRAGKCGRERWTEVSTKIISLGGRKAFISPSLHANASGETLGIRALYLELDARANEKPPSLPHVHPGSSQRPINGVSDYARHNIGGV